MRLIIFHTILLNLWRGLCVASAFSAKTGSTLSLSLSLPKRYDLFRTERGSENINKTEKNICTNCTGNKTNKRNIVPIMSARAPHSDPALAGLPQLIEDLQRLCEDQDSADVVFICGRDDEKIYAHRSILMAR